MLRETPDERREVSLRGAHCGRLLKSKILGFGNRPTVRRTSPNHRHGAILLLLLLLLLLLGSRLSGRRHPPERSGNCTYRSRFPTNRVVDLLLRSPPSAAVLLRVSRATSTAPATAPEPAPAPAPTAPSSPLLLVVFLWAARRGDGADGLRVGVRGGGALSPVPAAVPRLPHLRVLRGARRTPQHAALSPRRFPLPPRLRGNVHPRSHRRRVSKLRVPTIPDRPAAITKSALPNLHPLQMNL
jgi:hypothetical protein